MYSFSFAYHLRMAAHLQPFVDVPLSFLLTMAVSTFSWQLFENPINKLKSKFPYTQLNEQ